MAQKEIYIDGIRVGRGTSVKGAKEVSRSETNTFDGVVQYGLDKVPYSVEIGKIQADTKDEYIALDNAIDEMSYIKKTITVVENLTDSNCESWTITRHYLRCLVDSKDYELSAEDLTSESLKFMAEDMTKVVD